METEIISEKIAYSLKFFSQYVLDEKDRKGYWEDERITALAVWALKEISDYTEIRLRKNDDSGIPITININGILKKAIHYLNEKLKKDEVDSENFKCMNYEAWDTSDTIMALLCFNDQVSKENVRKSIAWLDHIKDKDFTAVWYDEMWESTKSAIAILKAGKEDIEWAMIERLMKWFNDIPSKQTGEFVSPHYSGFLVWLLGEINLICDENFKRLNTYTSFKIKVEKALEWIIASVLDNEGNPKKLWSKYLFSNAYILMGISVYYKTDKTSLTDDFLKNVINWFYTKARNKEAEDVEDSALATIGLSYLRTLLHLNFSQVLDFTPDTACFLGYSKHSQKFAKLLERHILDEFPQIQVINWANTRSGSIFEGVKKNLNNADISFFVITENREENAKSKVPNLMFELGYSISKLGEDRTFIIAERGLARSHDLFDIEDLICIEIEADEISKPNELIKRIKPEVDDRIRTYLLAAKESDSDL